MRKFGVNLARRRLGGSRWRRFPWPFFFGGEWELYDPIFYWRRRLGRRLPHTVARIGFEESADVTGPLSSGRTSARCPWTLKELQWLGMDGLTVAQFQTAGAIMPEVGQLTFWQDQYNTVHQFKSSQSGIYQVRKCPSEIAADRTAAWVQKANESPGGALRAAGWG